TCGQAGGVVTCTGGTLDGSSDLIPGVPQSRVITIKVLAPANIQSLATDLSNISVDIVNHAVVDPDNAIAESNETNNSSSWTTTVRSKINLKVGKTGPDTANQNDEADYVITVTNEDLDSSGGATALGVKVVDTLPVGLIPLSVKADPSNFACSVQENPVNV